MFSKKENRREEINPSAVFSSWLSMMFSHYLFAALNAIA